MIGEQPVQDVYAIAATEGGALEQIKQDISSFELEPGLRESVRQHYSNLESLAAGLRNLGIDDTMIDQHVIEIFEKYRIELLRAIAAGK
jgi:hypothetical protein